jgi:hypothetical protein
LAAFFASLLRAYRMSDAKSLCANLSRRRLPAAQRRGSRRTLDKQTPIGRVGCHVFDPIDPPPEISQS